MRFLRKSSFFAILIPGLFFRAEVFFSRPRVMGLGFCSDLGPKSNFCTILVEICTILVEKLYHFGRICTILVEFVQFLSNLYHFGRNSRGAGPNSRDVGNLVPGTLGRWAPNSQEFGTLAGNLGICGRNSTKMVQIRCRA